MSTAITDPHDTPDTYSSRQKLLHWAVVALVALQYLAFDSISRDFGRGMQSGELVFSQGGIAHSIAGSLILVLMLWRLAIRRAHGVPSSPQGEPDWAATLAGLTHVAFYAVLIAMPLLGLIAWFLEAGWAARLHEFGANVVLGMIALHVGAVVFHQVVWKSSLLKRMT
ncbi:Cytochrome (plasmid) [Rhodovulum sp. P5]|uniref:cytochrome b n=1 Tax=Rhodovulum sp. P5 TaxID=1564506 RepID=UPI0009C3742E|nr:cytochrome b/b6 domain-containing protein [Rhodovulum sp. P5]ARE42435.1 Cytochrome [Rhodovulum sp. P5]